MKMNMPQKGSLVYVEGYGGAIYAGGIDLQSKDAGVMLKFESKELNEGYGKGIITIPLEEFNENRVYPEQVASDECIIKSTKKRDEILSERKNNNK